MEIVSFEEFELKIWPRIWNWNIQSMLCNLGEQDEGQNFLLNKSLKSIENLMENTNEVCVILPPGIESRLHAITIKNMGQSLFAKIATWPFPDSSL